MDPDACEGRVADAALRCMLARGVAFTTLHDVAEAAGIDEGELRERFGDEDGLVGALVSPLLAGVRGVMTAAATTDLRRADELRNVLSGYFDAILAQRILVGLVLGDQTATSEPVRVVRAAMGAFRDSLADAAGAQLDGRIRASSALGAIHAAVVEVTDFDPTTVRAVIADAAVAILLS